MGIEVSLALMAASLAMAMATSFAAANAASEQREAQEEAAQANFDLQNEELTRQQEEVDKIAVEEKSDVVRRADAELGAIRAVAGDLGASATSVVRLSAEVGAVEGTDLSRIENNRKNRSDALQAGKKTVSQDLQNTITQAYNTEKAAVTKAKLGFVSSGLKIAGQAASTDFSSLSAGDTGPSSGSTRVEQIA